MNASACSRRAAAVLAAAAFSLLPASCPSPGSKTETPAPSRIAVLGDSNSMGIQDAGLVRTAQMNSYPCLIAKQMGRASLFQQPLVSAPGIGVPPLETPLTLDGGELVVDTLEPEDYANLLLTILQRLENRELERPYDNLAVNGARLNDLRNTRGYGDPPGNDNFFFDIVLRNLAMFSPSFGGTTMVEQALMLQPELILLWIGSNDVLGYVMGGGEDETEIADPDEFALEYQAVVDELAATGATIVVSNIQEYLPYVFALDGVFDSGVPVLFDPYTMQPLDFGSGPIPLLVDDDGAPVHLTLQAALDYITTGRGVPDTLTQDQRDSLTSRGVVLGAGVGQPLGPDVCLTAGEKANGLAAIAELNSRITSIAAAGGIPVVDINGLLKAGGLPAGVDASLDFVFLAQVNTVFSLDGVHPSNLGHALIANRFIETINDALGLTIPPVDPADYAGQYSGKSLTLELIRALEHVRKF